MQIEKDLRKGINMKFVLALAALLAAGILLMGAGSPEVTYVGHDKVAAALSKGGTFITQQDLLVLGSHRDKAGQVEVHDKETDVVYMVEGEATFVTGGTGVGMKRTTPGQWLGTDIQGGETHHLTKGDVIVVPAGTPHWYKEVEGSVTYLEVRFDVDLGK